jgi:large subunit ribosomal protein L4
LKAKEENIVVVENFDFEAPKTKSFVNVLKSLGIENKKSLFVLDESNKNVYLSSRNLQGVNIVNGSGIATYEVLNANKVVLSESCLEEIESNFSK